MRGGGNTTRGKIEANFPVPLWEKLT